MNGIGIAGLTHNRLMFRLLLPSITAKMKAFLFNLQCALEKLQCIINKLSVTITLHFLKVNLQTVSKAKNKRALFDKKSYCQIAHRNLSAVLVSFKGQHMAD